MFKQSLLSLQRWLSVFIPAMPNPADTKLASALASALAATTLITIIPFVLTIGRGDWETTRLFGYAAGISVNAMALVLLHRGALRIVGVGYSALIFCGLVGLSVQAGVQNPRMLGFLVVILFAGLFGSVRAGTAMSVLTVSAVGLILAGENAGILPLQPDTWPIQRVWIAYTTTALTAGIFTVIAVHTLRTALSDSRRAEETADAFVRESSDAMLFVGPDGIIIAVNPAGAEISGRTATDLVGRDWLTLVSEGSRSEVSEAFEQLIAGGDPSSVEFEIARASGELIPVEVKARTFTTRKGLLAVHATVRDIRDRRLAEDEKLDVERRLFDAQRLESIGRLAGGVAHDFNNLLTVVSGNASWLQEESLSTEQREAVDEVMDAADRAAQLTRQLLTVGRRQVSEPIVLEPGERVEQLESLLRRLLPANVALEVSRTPYGDCARVDPSQLEQIVVNLVANARDALPLGGSIWIDVDASDVDPPEFAGESPAAGWVVVKVRDNGEGMSSETLALVFEPFFTTKDVGHGTGLGLATVLGIVQQIGGRLDVESKEGAGTCFRIFLPRVIEPLADQPARLSTPYGDAMGERILLVEDDAAVRHITGSVLVRAGYRVQQVACAEEALLEGVADDAELVVTDVVMPGISGPELVGELRRRHAGLPVLFVSGYVDHTIVRHGVLDEGVDLLRKPFRPDELLERVRAVLDANSDPAADADRAESPALYA